MTILSKKVVNTEYKLFFGEYSGFQRFDLCQFPFFKSMHEKMRSKFWTPEIIQLTQDKQGFWSLPENARAVIEKNLLLQTMMDSVQSRSLSSYFAASATEPNLEACFMTQGFFEEIHSISYSYIIRSIYPDSRDFFDRADDYPEIRKRVDDEINAYDIFIDNKDNESLVKALMRMYALEGIKFYISFLLTYLINDRYGYKIKGITREIKLIQRDELLHVQFVSGLLQIMKRLGYFDDDWKKTFSEIMDDAEQSEIEWANYLLSDSPIKGISISTYVEFIHYMRKERENRVFKTRIPKKPSLYEWFEMTSDIDSQLVSLQEAENLSYNIGRLKNDF